MGGFTDFGYLCYVYSYLLVRNPMPLFRYLASSNQLDDFVADKTPASSSPYGYYSPAIDYARLSVPGLFGLISKSCGDDKPQLSWTSITWRHIKPEIVVELVDKGQTISLREFQTGKCIRKSQSVAEFIRVYFCYGYIREWPPLSLDAEFEQFRTLCRYAFKGAFAEDLSRNSKFHGNMTPLMAMVYHTILDPFNGGKTFVKVEFTMILRLLLQDLKSCGIDLEEYGRNEWQAWRSSKLPYEDTKVFTSRAHRGPRLAFFNYGPEPKDWSFELDYFTPEYARDFWDMVEAPPPPPPMPGAWVEDD